MKIATVFDSSLPVSMMRRHRGMISVVRRNVIVGDEFVLPWLPGVPDGFKAEVEDGSFLTSAPITPREVRRRYSNGRDLDVVLRNGYKNSGICAVIHVR
jgi:hypothetical protein